MYVDTTGTEVDGELFERTRTDWEGRRGYWLHTVFLGGLWAAGQLCPGGGRVTLNWRTLLEWTAGMVPAGTPTWLRADNAHCKGDLVRLCAKNGWDYSISLTNDTWRRPVPEQIEGLSDDVRTDIGTEEEAIFATHRPTGWDAEQHYVVVRRRTENGQGLLVPLHTVILVSRDDLPLADLVLRHRGKQAFYALGWIAQVLLRAVQFTALPKRARRHGLRPVVWHVMRFAKTNFHLDWLYEAMQCQEPRTPPTALAA